MYDGEGNRVAKTVGGVTTKYLVDDLNPTGYLQVLEEVSGGAVQARYTYGTALVTQTRSVASAPTVSYYGYDAHGNVAFLADASGTVTDTYNYDTFGDLVASVGSTPNTHLFAGEEMDPDLGLLNLRARQYAPGAGRFLTVDPINGEPLSPISFNRYLYAEADPANRLDPLGMAGGEDAIMLGPSAEILAPRTVFLGAVRSGAKQAIKVSLIFSVGYIVACELHTAERGLAMIGTGGAGLAIAMLPPYPFQFCMRKGEAQTDSNTNPVTPKKDCRQIKNDICIPECWEDYQSSRSRDISDYFKCLADCQIRHGCSPIGPGLEPITE